MVEISSEEPKYDTLLARRIFVMGKPLSDSMPGMPVNRTLITLQGMREIYSKLKKGEAITDSGGKEIPIWIISSDIRQAVLLRERILEKNKEYVKHSENILKELRYLESLILEYREGFHVGKKEIKDE